VSEYDLVTRLITGGTSGGRVPGKHGERRDIRRKSVADTAGTLMTSPPVTIRPTASLVEAARTAAKAHVRRLPVVDDQGVIVGIVTRADLVTVFLRDDDELRDLIRKEVLTSRFCADPSTVEVVVEDGVVTLTGQLERRMQIAPTDRGDPRGRRRRQRAQRAHLPRRRQDLPGRAWPAVLKVRTPS